MTLETMLLLTMAVTLVAILGVVICIALLVHGAAQDFRLDVVVERDDDDDDDEVGADLPQLDEERAAEKFTTWLETEGYIKRAEGYIECAAPEPVPAEVTPAVYPSFRSVLDAVDGARQAMRDLVNSDADLSEAEGKALLDAHVALGRHALALKDSVARADQ